MVSDASHNCYRVCSRGVREPNAEPDACLDPVSMILVSDRKCSSDDIQRYLVALSNQGLHGCACDSRVLRIQNQLEQSISGRLQTTETGKDGEGEWEGRGKEREKEEEVRGRKERERGKEGR